jgi:hypothetical protein
MEFIQRPEDLVLPDVAAFAPPVLRVLDEIADRKADIGRDRREHAHNPAAPADLHVQLLLAVDQGDPLLVDLGEVVKRERVLCNIANFTVHCQDTGSLVLRFL